jgi:hypothetical protein
MPPHHFFLREEFLAVARMMRGDLCCRCAVYLLLAQMVLDY